jgi:hypothetical protein
MTRLSICRVFGELLLVLACSIVVGSGIGVLEGMCAWGRDREHGPVFITMSATIGSMLGSCLGPILYYFVFKRNITAKPAGLLIAIVAGTGCVMSFFLGDVAWLTVYVVPVVAVFVAVVVR